MTRTVYGPEEYTLPMRALYTWVETKPTWDDDWAWDPNLEFVSAELHSAAAGLDAAQFLRRYSGQVKQPWQSDFAALDPLAYCDSWVRVGMLTEQGEWAICWVGRIAGEARDIHGASNEPAGHQLFDAYGPKRLLERISVSDSVWGEDGGGSGDEWTVGWIPPMNSRTKVGAVRGNRTDEKLGTEFRHSYVHGGHEVWTHYDYLEYILKRYANEEYGPQWTITGQVDLLKTLKETFDWGTTQTVADIVAALIDPKFGLDYKIVPREDDEGFSIEVFGLTIRDFTYAGATIPRNPNVVHFRVGETPDCMSARIVRSQNDLYGKIRVVGARAVICGSWWGTPNEMEIDQGWPNDLRIIYDRGDGSADSSAKAQDEVRATEQYEQVYQEWHVYPEQRHRPILDDRGNLLSGSYSDVQATIRSTLSWTPLQKGVDYTQDPPVDNNADLAGVAVTPEFHPPQAWFWDSDKATYQPSEECEVSVRALKDNWGLHLESSPNHRLGLNIFGNDGPSTTLVQPKYNVASGGCVFTLAFEADWRLRLVYEQDDWVETDGVIDIAVDDAQYWYLAENTALYADCDETAGGVAAQGRMELSGEAKVLRSDVDRLAPIMAGAIARYAQIRGRAEITIKGYRPLWCDLIGKMLGDVVQTAIRTKIHGPITSVRFRDNTTVVSAGFALS